jgi:hypothetical protein
MFYILEIGGFNQLDYAYYEVPDSAKYSDKFPTCPKCNNPIGGKYWLPPYDVSLFQTKIVGDFIFGAGGPDFIVSKKFIDLYYSEGFRGIESHFPVRIKSNNRTKLGLTNTINVLYGIYLSHTKTQLNYDKMGVKWGNTPQSDYCDLCGPGGGGKSGWWQSRECVVVDNETWDGSDIFYASNDSNTIILSERAARMISENNLTNCKVIPVDEADYKFY